jgi:hypothetical protein
MHFTRMLVAGLAVTGLVACSEDPVSKFVTPEPFASIRWVNAVADTVAMDYRIVDHPSNASEPNLPFRASSGNWRNLPPGAHQIRVFFTNTTAAGTDVSVVSQVIVDTTLTFEVGRKYTIVHYGFTKAGATPADRLILIEDVPPTPAATQIGVRAINAAPAFGSVDVFAEPATANSMAPATTPPIFSNLAPAGIADWTGLAALPGPVPPATTPPATSYRFAAAPTATIVPTASVLAPPGQRAVPSDTVAGVVSQPLDAIAGTQHATSALTAVIYGPQVSYTLRTPTGGSVVIAAGTTGAVGVLLDKHPPRISPTGP